MVLKAFAIYDSKAILFGLPFFMSSTGGAVRAFGDLAVDKQSSISKHPKDYILYEIGTYDDLKGEFFNVKPSRNLGLASDYVPVVSPNVAVLADDVIAPAQNGQANLPLGVK